MATSRKGGTKTPSKATAGKHTSSKRAQSSGGDEAAPDTRISTRRKVDTSNIQLSNPSVPVALGAGGLDATIRILAENLGATGQLTISDLTRITIPTGGGTAWQMPNAVGGRPKTFDELDCVVIAFKDQKAFWRKSLDDTGGGTPPDCRSIDMVQGIGDPGVECAGCEFNEFGSAKGGTAEGKACKDLRFLFIMHGPSKLPKLLIIPPTSLKALRRYFLDLAGNEMPYYGVVTRLTLTVDKNANGIKYSKIEASMVSELNDAEYAMAEKFNEYVLPMIGALANQISAQHVQ